MLVRFENISRKKVSNDLSASFTTVSAKVEGEKDDLSVPSSSSSLVFNASGTFEKSLLSSAKQVVVTVVMIVPS